MEHFKENVSVDEGVDANGIRTILHFQDDEIITQKTFDAEPMIEQCAAERKATAGERWGEMRKVGTIPMAVYGKAILIQDQAERRKYLRTWLLQNPAFISFDKYAK